MNYFDAPENLVRLQVELAGWAGTRFVSRTSGRPKKGVGADCVTFVESVLVRVGAIARILWPEYVTHTGGAAMGELLFATLDAIPRFKKLTGLHPSELIPGDLLAFSGGDRGHHLAIYAGENEMVHCVLKGGVCHANVYDPIIRGNLKAVYRSQV